jgi:hypothetical protein
MARIDMMNSIRIFRIKPLGIFVIYMALDIFCMGVGMGVPFFNIIFGFLVGWYIVKWVSVGTSEVNDILKRMLIYSCITAGVTFLGMLLIWGWSAKMLYSPEVDIVNFGIPQILYEPRMSLIAWLVLMIAISPFLQLLTTVFAGHLTLLSLYRKKKTLGEKSGVTA